MTRGGRVVVVDPRRTETAKAFEHVAVRPDGDAWLLLAMLHVIFGEGLDDKAAISRRLDRRRHAAPRRRRMLARDRSRQRSGVPAEEIRALARDVRHCSYGQPPTAGPAPASGRTPRWSTSCSTRSTSSPATSTGRAGWCSAAAPIDFTALADRRGMATTTPSAPGSANLPEVLGQLPAPLMAAEIETPGRGTDQGPDRLGRQPGAVGARLERARTSARFSSNCRSASTCT